MKIKENLTKEEELSLGVKIQAMLQVKKTLEENAKPSTAQRQIIRAGESAATQLIQSNIRLVYKLANSFKKRMPLSPDIEELYADGMLGLARAVNKYDPSKCNKFSTLATPWIHQAISRGVNSTYRLVRLPENRVADYINIIKIQKEYTESNLTSKEISEIVMDRLNLTESKYNKIINAAATHVSLNKTIGGEDEGEELISYTKELQNMDSAEAQVMNDEMAIILDTALSLLAPLEAEIISSAFKLDLDGHSQKTATLIKSEHELSASEYKHALNSGVKKIKEYMDSYGVGFEDFFKD